MSVFRPSSHALITGGASGMGYAVAELCLSHNMQVTIIDSNQETLNLAEKNLKGDVKCLKLDVGEKEDWKTIRQEIGVVDFLMLNAGTAAQGTWGDDEYFEKILKTNLNGVINGLNTFVPSFQSRPTSSPPSAIVITGSKQGITNPPSSPAYNASKAAVKALAEHISYDLKDVKGLNVHLLVPGMTFTGLSGNTPGSQQKKPEGAWSPSQVVEYMHDKMNKGKFYIICPDNEVTEEMDKKRMMWGVGDIVNGRPALARWRPEYKNEYETWMAKDP